MGLFLVYAGWDVEEVEAQPWGAWMLIAVAVGLVAYGAYLLLAARYLRLITTW